MSYPPSMRGDGGRDYCQAPVYLHPQNRQGTGLWGPRTKYKLNDYNTEWSPKSASNSCPRGKQRNLLTIFYLWWDGGRKVLVEEFKNVTECLSGWLSWLELRPIH